MKIRPRFSPFLLVMVVIVTFSLPVSAQEEGKQTLFTNVNIFDGKSERLATGMDVLVEGDLITRIGSGLTAGDGATAIDGGGRTLMPGMIDSHVHFNVVIEGGLKEIEAARWDRIASVAAHAARDWLMDGFTTVRGMGGMGNGLKMTIDEGLLNGLKASPTVNASTVKNRWNGNGWQRCPGPVCVSSAKNLKNKWSSPVKKLFSRPQGGK